MFWRSTDRASRWNYRSSKSDWNWLRYEPRTKRKSRTCRRALPPSASPTTLSRACVLANLFCLFCLGERSLETLVSDCILEPTRWRSRPRVKSAVRKGFPRDARQIAFPNRGRSGLSLSLSLHRLGEKKGAKIEGDTRRRGARRQSPQAPPRRFALFGETRHFGSRCIRHDSGSRCSCRAARCRPARRSSRGSARSATPLSSTSASPGKTCSPAAPATRPAPAQTTRPAAAPRPPRAEAHAPTKRMPHRLRPTARELPRDPPSRAEGTSRSRGPPDSAFPPSCPLSHV